MFRVSGFGLYVSSSVFRVSGSGVWCSGFEFRIGTERSARFRRRRPGSQVSQRWGGSSYGPCDWGGSRVPSIVKHARDEPEGEVRRKLHAVRRCTDEVMRQNCPLRADSIGLCTR